MYAIRSFAVATFLIGLGHEPLDVEFNGYTPVYLFRDDAHADLPRYNDAKQRLDMMIERKRPGGAR
jgi:hypothetical protein